MCWGTLCRGPPQSFWLTESIASKASGRCMIGGPCHLNYSRCMFQAWISSGQFPWVPEVSRVCVAARACICGTYLQLDGWIVSVQQSPFWGSPGYGWQSSSCPGQMVMRFESTPWNRIDCGMPWMNASSNCHVDLERIKLSESSVKVVFQ